MNNSWVIQNQNTSTGIQNVVFCVTTLRSQAYLRAHILLDVLDVSPESEPATLA
jgi:hypothetical protein